MLSTKHGYRNFNEFFSENFTSRKTYINLLIEEPLYSSDQFELNLLNKWNGVCSWCHQNSIITIILVIIKILYGVTINNDLEILL